MELLIDFTLNPTYTNSSINLLTTGATTMRNRITQPFSYYGGKQRLSSHIIPLIPKHLVYIEPFFGGGTIFFKKPFPNTIPTAYSEVINDYDNRIITFFRVLQNPDTFEELLHRLHFTPYSQAEHVKSAEILKNENRYNDIDRAWAWFVQCNMGFAKRIYSGWGTGVFGGNQASTWAGRLDLSRFFERMVSTHICCCDAIECLKRFNSPQSFAYIDPPYIGTDCGKYIGYTVEQYKDLLEYLDKEYLGSFILSGYNNEYANSYGWSKKELKAINSSKGSTRCNKSSKAVREGTSRTEVLWLRGRTAPLREEVIKYYNREGFSCFYNKEVYNKSMG